MACNAWRSGGSYGGVQVRRDLYGRGVLEYLQLRFLSGKPYGEEEVQSGIMDAVVSESVARRLYGTTGVVGRTVEISYVPIPSVPSCGMSPCWPSLPMAMSGCLIPRTILV